MSQNSGKAFKFAPAENGEKRVELGFDGDNTILHLSSWVDGLGWCGEKTMQIEPDMLDELHRMIGAARVRLRQQRLDANEEASPSKVLNFPLGK